MQEAKSLRDSRWASLPRLVSPALLGAMLTGFPLIAAGADQAPPKIARKSDDSSSATTRKHPIAPALRAAKTSRDQVQKLSDYQYTFTAREMVRNQLSQQKMTMKIRQQPFSVYVKYIDPHPGREVIYVEGENKGKLLVHEDGFKSLAGTLSFDPHSDQAMRENRYPITQAGMAFMLDAIIGMWQQEMNFGEAKLAYYPQAKIDGSPCKMYEVTHPVARDHFKFHKTRLYIDVKTALPVRVEQYAFPQAGAEPQLVEEYTFSNLQTNLGMTANDFSTKNKAYNF